MDVEEVFEKLKAIPDPYPEKLRDRAKMITNKQFGTRIPDLRKLAKEIGKDTELAKKLWKTGYREGKILAGHIEELKYVDEKLMDEWVLGFDSWEVCDAVINALFHKTEFAYKKAVDWSNREEEFVKRAGFVMIATLAVHDKKSPDSTFIELLPLIKEKSIDERNFVKKAVNWALRQIGKKNLNLNKFAVKFGEEIQKLDSRSAKWIAADALRELKSEKIQTRLKEKERKLKKKQKKQKK
ncbi:MAG: DNA alkylation repair protein [archaeon]|nr:DNA alkylation repair protein [archaeon]